MFIIYCILGIITLFGTTLFVVNLSELTVLAKENNMYIADDIDDIEAGVHCGFIVTILCIVIAWVLWSLA